MLKVYTREELGCKLEELLKICSSSSVIDDLYENIIEEHGEFNERILDRILEVWQIQQEPIQIKALKFLRGFIKYHTYTLGRRLILSYKTANKLRKRGLVWYDARLMCYVREEICCKKLGG